MIFTLGVIAGVVVGIIGTFYFIFKDWNWR